MASSSMQPQHIPGPPYPSRTAGLGGLPTVGIDVPISSVLLPFYIGFAAYNMTTFILNRKRQHKFIPSAACFGFCMSRIVALVFRIAWATHPKNVSIAIAANIFANAGVLVIFVVHIIFVQRVIRAYHPRFGWAQPLRWVFHAIYFCVGAVLIMVIISAIWTQYTLDTALQNRLRIVRLVALTFFALLAFIPLPIAIIAPLIPRSNSIDKFGHGRMRTKIAILIINSTLLTLGAGFRCGVSFVKRPVADPGWFNSRACYYCFIYVIEIIVLAVLAVSRCDLRFHIPNGSSGPGHYSGGGPPEKGERSDDGQEDQIPQGDSLTEEQEKRKEQDWETRLQHESEN